ncbi:MAG: D-2-hydroxyacid dehydrogenase [Acidobacteria bacterium]|nr:D-2-hydroxyacid dehydrogenase [Acidobacteriota bacterium]
MKRLLIDVPLHAASLERLRVFAGVTVDIVETPEERRRLLPAAMLREAAGLFCTFPPENFEECRRLRWIQTGSVGYTQFTGLGLAGRGIELANARGCFDVPIAEWNIAMIVNLARDLRGMIRHQEAGIWDRDARFQREIRGGVVGIWGYGGIGRETARLAKQLGMTVQVLTRSPVGAARDVYRVPGTGDPDGTLPHRVFTQGERYEFLSGLDYLILAMPLSPATEGIVGGAELEALPRHAFLLNPARGPLVREQALIEALQHGTIAGAAIDTHYRYPLPPDHPLWSMPNVILTPHISGSSLSPYYRMRLWEIFLINVERWLEGRSLLNRVDGCD